MYKKIDLTYFTIQKMLILLLIRSIYFKLKKSFILKYFKSRVCSQSRNKKKV